MCHCALVVVEEENELEGVAVASMSFNKLGEQERHLVRHRELFLSRQIETYKIDMVRYVSLSLSDLHFTSQWTVNVCVRACVHAVVSAQ